VKVKVQIKVRLEPAGKRPKKGEIRPGFELTQVVNAMDLTQALAMTYVLATKMAVKLDEAGDP